MTLIKDMTELKKKLDDAQVSSTLTDANTFSPDMISWTLQLKRALDKETHARDLAKAKITEMKNGQKYLDHASDIVNSITKVIDDAAKKMVAKAKERYRDEFHVLNLIHLGAPEGQDWHTGMPPTKGNKPRTWATYVAHASETIMKFDKMVSLEDQIKSVQKASTLTIHTGFLYKDP